MDNFKAVYKILSTLEKSMDLQEVDMESIDYKALDISKERWCRYIEMMIDVGYIKGASVKRDITGSMRVECSDMRITLKGLEYLQENSIMVERCTIFGGSFKTIFLYIFSIFDRQCLINIPPPIKPVSDC